MIKYLISEDTKKENEFYEANSLVSEVINEGRGCRDVPLPWYDFCVCEGRA
jgi:hypothetical protein